MITKSANEIIQDKNKSWVRWLPLAGVGTGLAGMGLGAAYLVSKSKNE